MPAFAGMTARGYCASTPTAVMAGLVPAIHVFNALIGIIRPMGYFNSGPLMLPFRIRSTA